MLCNSILEISYKTLYIVSMYTYIVSVAIVVVCVSV